MLHGFCETGVIWENFVEELSRNYQVITIDLPGFGESPLPENPFSVSDIADQVFQFAKDQNLQQAVVIGHSLGGYITLELAKKHPDFVKAFGLFHSSAFADNDEKKNSRNKVIDFVKQRGVKVFAQSLIPGLFFHKNRKKLAPVIEEVVKIAASTPKDTLIQYTKAMRDRNDRTDVLKDFGRPILIIAGDKDPAVPIEKTMEQIDLPKQPVVHILKDVGHMGMFEAPEISLAAIKDFVRLATS